MVTPVWEILYRILAGKQTYVRFFVVFFTPSMQMLGTLEKVLVACVAPPLNKL